MHDALQKEIATYEKRTRKSAVAHRRALERIPLGVASNYRHYEPYPIFLQDGKGSRIHDVDGNEYVDHNLCFGALMAGHSHPAVVQAVEQKLRQGTTFGMPHEQEWELAEEISKRYPVEMVRFGSSGTEVTMHACRIARAATGRDKILKFEGSYHGLHDTALVSVKPKAEDYGDPDAPSSVPAGGGVPKSALENVVVASFNNLKSVEHRFEQYPGQIAAIILERSEEHTSELQSQSNLVCRLLLEKKKALITTLRAPRFAVSVPVGSFSTELVIFSLLFCSCVLVRCPTSSRRAVRAFCYTSCMYV